MCSGKKPRLIGRLLKPALPAISKWLSGMANVLPEKKDMLQGKSTRSRPYPAALGPRLAPRAWIRSPGLLMGTSGTGRNDDPRSCSKEPLFLTQTLPNRVKGLGASDTWMQFMKESKQGKIKES